jgi:tripartite-type tricarboxylate transporter receptor subunit TctC
VGGSIGAGRVARATPDGYTLVLGIWNTHVANGAIYALQYDIVKDFEPIALLADAPMLLVAHRSVPANDLKELIAWLKANPDKASMGTVGAGSPPHLLGVLLQKETGTRFGLVAYRGASSAKGISGGAVNRFLAVTTRAFILPARRRHGDTRCCVGADRNDIYQPGDVTAARAGLPGFYFSLWAGLFAPRARRQSMAVQKGETFEPVRHAVGVPAPLTRVPGTAPGACRIIPPSRSTNSCLGIGNGCANKRPPRSARPS